MAFLVLKNKRHIASSPCKSTDWKSRGGDETDDDEAGAPDANRSSNIKPRALGGGQSVKSNETCCASTFKELSPAAIRRGFLAVDTGCTAHLAPNTHNMKNLRPMTRKIVGFDNVNASASTHIGDEHSVVKLEDGSLTSMVRKNVLVVPGIRFRLFSVKSHINHGHSAIFGKDCSSLHLSNGTNIPIELNGETGMFAVTTISPNKASLQNEKITAMPAAHGDEDVHPAVGVDFNRSDVVETKDAVTKEQIAAESQPFRENTEPEHVPDETHDALIRGICSKELRPYINKAQTMAMKAHERSGHTNIRDLILIARDGGGFEELLHLPTSFELEPPCHTCALAKSRARPLPKGPVQRASYVNERVFMDTTGRLRIMSHLGNYYHTLRIDDCSDYTDCISHRTKASIPEVHKKMNVRQGMPPKILRSDGAGEFTSDEFENLLLQDGTFHEKSAPDYQHQNGRAEAKVGRIKGRARANAVHANTPAKYHDEGMSYATVQENVTRPYKKGASMTPFERHHGKPFPSHLLKPWGCWAKIHLGKQRTIQSAPSMRGRAGIFLGFAFHKGFSAYQILHPDTGKISKVPFEQVEFDEECFPYRNPRGQRWPPLDLTDEDDEQVEIAKNERMEPEDEEPYVLRNTRLRARKIAEDTQQRERNEEATRNGQDIDPASVPVIPEEDIPIIPNASLKIPSEQPGTTGDPSVYFDEALLSHVAFAATHPEFEVDIERTSGGKWDAGVLALAATTRKALGIEAENVKTWNQAMKGKNVVHWLGARDKERAVLFEKEAIRVVSDEELDELLRNGTPILTGRNALKEKTNESGEFYMPKCRAVLHGFKEIQYRDFYKTFAAVASGTAIRTAVSLGVGSGARFHHVNIKGAYLNSPNAVRQYMWAPDGIAKKKRECWEVLSSIYGKRSAGYDWKQTFVPAILKFGFKAATID